MSTNKTNKVVKEPVRIRFKELSNGNKSIYLDTYIRGRRRYDFLRLYLIPERDQASKTQNAATMAAAIAIKSQKIIEITNNIASGITEKHPTTITLSQWSSVYLAKEQGMVSYGTILNIKRTMKILSLFGDNVEISRIDKDYCLHFISYMQCSYVPGKGCRTQKSTSRHLDGGTVLLYWKIFKAMLNSAVREGVIASNPAYLLDSQERPKGHDSRCVFLTIDEQRKMMDTPAENSLVKQAFLFSCFCGLRISDISRLTWNMITENNGTKIIELRITKTKEILYLPLNNMAIRHLPARHNASEHSKVFNGLPTKSNISHHLDKWAKKAGIRKRITFHVARHTFATTSLTLGADIYTTSKLLGHKNIKTTQVYAKIIDKKKEEIMALFDRAF